MIAAGVSTDMGSYELTGASDTISISLAAGTYQIICGNVKGSFTVTTT